MQVRLKKSWSQWSAGHVFTEMPGGQARTLIARGIAEDMSGDVVEAKAMTAPVNRMMRSGRESKSKALAK